MAGFNFRASVMPWPVRFIETKYDGIKQSRLVRGSVSVLRTSEIEIRANNSTRRALGYKFGDDLSEPPTLRTENYKFSVVGQRDYPEIEISKPLPGQMEILSITQEVTF
jgi:hypothetical protein